MLKTLLVGLVVGASAIAAPPAPAETTRRSELEAGFSSAAPGTSTGLRLGVVYRAAGDPDAKPSPIRSLLIALPTGTVFDASAAPECRASDAELTLLGPAACPAASQVGSGSFTAITGIGAPVDPFVGDLYVFHGPAQLIEVVTAPGTRLPVGIDRLRVSEGTISARPAPVPGGPPDGQTAVREVRLTIPARTAGAHTLFTTPPDCPASDAWTSRGTFGFADGTSDEATATTPCRASTRKERVSTRIWPRRVMFGTRTRFRVRVRPGTSLCAAGATVRLNRRRARTDERGRATIITALRRHGGARLSYRKRGCVAEDRVVRVGRAR